MKKFISIVLVLVLALSLSTMAFAGTVANPDPSTATTFTFEKNYKTTAGQTPAQYPAETLQFNVTKAATNPNDTMISIADTTVDGNPDNIVVTVPAYTAVGKYNYTVTETAGNTQGVTYATNSFGVQVLVSYNDDHTALVAETTFTTSDGANGKKVDSITNTYDLGALSVTKTVSGNLADQNKEFEVDVTFNATKDVKSDITYTDGTEAKTITAADMDDGTQTVTITLKHNETVTFNNIPAGVTYTVVEKAKHLVAAGGTMNPNSAEDYTATYTNESGTIAADTTTAATINNAKGTTVDTGVALDNLPYVMLIAVAVVGLAVVTTKKYFAKEN